MLRFLSFSLALLLSPAIYANPIETSWFTKYSGQYARLYTDQDAVDSNFAVTFWDHPRGNDQLIPTYAGVHEISVTNTDLYIRTSGLDFHIVGPWFNGRGDLFNNFPGNIALAARFPLTPEISTIPRPLTGGGPIGFLVDGVAMFDSRDALSYRNDVGLDEPTRLPPMNTGPMSTQPQAAILSS